MTDDLPERVRALLSAEREAPAEPAEVRQAIRSKVSATIAKAATTSGGGAAAIVKLAMLSTIIGALVVGAIVVVRMHAAPPVVSPSIPSVDTEASMSPHVVDPRGAAPEAPPAPAPVWSPPAPPPASPVSAGSADIGTEAPLLAAATRALRRGDGELALISIEEHARRFPNGELAEERDVLRIEALFATGRRDEAKDAVRAFARSYPNSVHHRLIEQASQESSP